MINSTKSCFLVLLHILLILLCQYLRFWHFCLQQSWALIVFFHIVLMLTGYEIHFLVLLISSCTGTLDCCVRAFSTCSEQIESLAAVHWLLIASLVMQHGCQGGQASAAVALELQSTGSVAVACRLSCPMACGIFLDQGLNPCPLHWQVEYQGSLIHLHLFTFLHLLFITLFTFIITDNSAIN